MWSKICAVLVILPALVYARIEIDVSATNNERFVDFQGSNYDLINDIEKNAFKLTNEKLGNAVRLYFGAWPDNIYLKSPTPWGDLYYTYGWPQVTRRLVPKTATIVWFKNDPTVLITNVYNNNGTDKLIYVPKVDEEFQNTVSTNWKTDNELMVEEDIVHNFDIKNEQDRFSFTSKWGENTTKKEFVKHDFISNVEVELKPNQTVEAVLYVNKTSMKIVVDYEATLSGDVAVNYDSQYKGHQFWSMDIKELMKVGHLDETVNSSETIDWVFYSDFRVLIRDMETKEILYDIPM